MKFLIAGLGSIGRRHLRNLLALGERDILLLRSNKSTLPDKDLEHFPAFSNLEDAIQEKPDAVIVSNPTSLHMDIAIPCAQAGCHLFLEKPISHTMQGIDRLEKLVHSQNLQVLVGFQFRFHPILNNVKELVESGIIGQPVSARAHWGEYLPGWHPWEDYRLSYSARAELGGGVVLTLCHPIDYLRWFFGNVEKVFAFTGKSSTLEMDVEDIAEITLQFQSGVLGSIHLDYIQRPSDHHIDIIGTEGWINWNYKDGSATLYQSKENQECHFSPPTEFTRNNMFISEMQHFIEILKSKATPKCSLDDGVRALEIALAVHQSHKSEAVVSL